MKWFFRYFFRIVRVILGPFVLLYERITAPKGLQRPEEKQKEIDRHTQNLVLYQYRTCPFCLKVRHAIKRLSLNISYCDAQFNSECRNGLLGNGGKVQVPCLRIPGKNGEDTWLYESKAIVRYLDQHYGHSQP